MFIGTGSPGSSDPLSPNKLPKNSSGRRMKKHWSISGFFSSGKWGSESKKGFQPPPIAEDKKVLVLDMDETLIHSSNFPPHSTISYVKSGDPEFYVFKRPGLDEFLEFCVQNFEVFIFTYGMKEYAEPVLDKLCPMIDKSHRLFRDSCQLKSDGVKKDLKIFGRSPKDIILIDDSSSAMNFNPKNTIQIPRWLGTPNDDALTKWLPEVLRRCSNAKDVRKIIANEKEECMKRKKALKARSMSLV